MTNGDNNEWAAVVPNATPPLTEQDKRDTSEAVITGIPDVLAEKQSNTEIDASEYFAALKKYRDAEDRKPTKFKVTQIRSTTSIEKRETVMYFPPDITPDDVDLDSCFENTDIVYEAVEHRPCAISTEWKVLETPNRFSTIHIEEGIKRDVIKCRAVTRDELIIVALHYLKICYVMELPSHYGWSKFEQGEYYHANLRFEQIANFIAQKDGIPSFQLWCHIYAYRKQADKIKAKGGFNSYFESSEERLVRKKEFYGYLEEVGWDGMDGDWNGWLGTSDAKVLECKEQLKAEAIASWEERKAIAKELRQTRPVVVPANNEQVT